MLAALLGDGAGVLGTLPGWLTLLALLFTLRTLARGGAGTAVSELAEANRVLEKRLHDERAAKEELGGTVRDLRIEVAELRGRTDWATAFTSQLAPVLEALAGHEERAAARHEASMTATRESSERMVNVLELVAARLGPEPNGHEAVAA